MELLQTVTGFFNTGTDCRIKIDRCELLYDAENVGVFLRINLDDNSEKCKNIKIGVGCYSEDGGVLAAMHDVPYLAGGMLVELPSLLTASVLVGIESATTPEEDELTWNSDFPKSLRCENFEESDRDEEFDKTEVFDASVINDEYEVKVSEMSSKESKRLARIRRYEEEEELRNFIKNDPNEKRKRRITRIVTAIVLILFASAAVLFASFKNSADTTYRKAMNLYNSGKFAEAVERFEELDDNLYFGDKKKELYWAAATANARERRFHDAALYYKELNGYKESFANYRSIVNAYSGIVSAGKSHTMALKNDGTVFAVGSNLEKQCDTSQWGDIIKVSAGGEHSVGLVRSGVVVAVGSSAKGQTDVSKWKNIIDISAGDNHTVGVNNTGSVEATGDNTYGQCEVDEWSGIISVSAGSRHTVGLKLDGTVVATGDNSHGECNVSKWSNVVLVTAGNGFTAGLTGDGKILFAGDDTYGISDAKKEKDIFSISAGGYNLLVVYTDGSVKSIGSNDRNQGVTDLWRNIVVTAGGEHHSVAVASDGKAYAVGSNDNGQTAVENICDVEIPKSTVTIRKSE